MMKATPLVRRHTIPTSAATARPEIIAIATCAKPLVMP
jgi:hypothetical protein